MMMTLLVTLSVVALVMGAMAIGVMISGKRLKGSCGGEGGPDCACELSGLKRTAGVCAAKQASATKR